MSPSFTVERIGRYEERQEVVVGSERLVLDDDDGVRGGWLLRAASTHMHTRKVTCHSSRLLGAA